MLPAFISSSSAGSIPSTRTTPKSITKVAAQSNRENFCLYTMTEIRFTNKMSHLSRTVPRPAEAMLRSKECGGVQEKAQNADADQPPPDHSDAEQRAQLSPPCHQRGEQQHGNQPDHNSHAEGGQKTQGLVGSHIITAPDHGQKQQGKYVSFHRPGCCHSFVRASIPVVVAGQTSCRPFRTASIWMRASCVMCP